MDWHINWNDEHNRLELLDQRVLPHKKQWFYCIDLESTLYALQTMVVRGAPAIGVTAAYGCYLAACDAGMAGKDWPLAVKGLVQDLKQARPTAVNLNWAVNKMTAAWLPEMGHGDLCQVWLALAKDIHARDKAICREIGRIGAVVLDTGDTVMTHCNAGALATAGYGTALGVVRKAIETGKNIKVIANETRPFLQGARLTAWELKEDDIAVKVACDNACSLLMQRGLVHKVVVGADRIAANGDTVNKIGTSTIAIAAAHYNIPFYVAAPLSTIDIKTATGQDIPIEIRPALEVSHIGDTCIVPENTAVFNYAFDVTPAQFITGIITEKVILRPPYNKSIADLFEAGV